MSSSESLKQVVAQLLDMSPDAITPEFSLRHPKLQSSARRGALAAAIERQLGVYSAKVFTVAKYAELEAAVLGTDGATNVGDSGPHAVGATAAAEGGRPSGGPQRAPTGPAGISVGVDVEMVENMPEAVDFWAEPFYSSHFTASEIAYCVGQQEPRVHFAARWCAKEALIKCDPAYAGAEPKSLQVSLTAEGQPVLERLSEGSAYPIRCALSLSHTALFAVAVVAAATID